MEIKALDLRMTCVIDAGLMLLCDIDVERSIKFVSVCET